VVFAGLIIAGVFGDFTVPLVAWLIVSTLAGAGCAVLFTGRRLVLSAVLGAIFGFGSLFAIPFYLDLRHPLGPTFFYFELILPFGLVGLPLYAVWQAVDGRTSPARQRDR
jgi:hypothetical protein